jgi:branched-chain amino acid transport system substrate-binding protein
MIDLPVSRRRFLHLLGTACALVGGGSLSGILTGCGKNQVATNTTATIAAGQTTTTTEPTTTTVSTTPEAGRPLRIGVLTAKTGHLALFGKADEWWMQYALAALPEGIVCGDHRIRKINFITADHGSTTETAKDAAAKLISDARVDLLMSSGASNVVNAAASQAEARECPFICDYVPWQPFILDRGGALDKPFKWTYAHAFGFEDISETFLRMWQQLLTNRKVGLLFPDDSHGRLWIDGSYGLPTTAADSGYEIVLPSLYAVPAGDFTAAIAEFKKNGCEICSAYMSTADLIRFWTQAKQLEFRPKVFSVAGAVLFPQAVDAIGSDATNMTAECLWQPRWPYSDSITGRTAQQLARDYTDATGEQWTIAIAQYSKFEWAVDVFKRVVDILDKEDTIARVRTTRLHTCLGLIDFTSPVGWRDPAKSRRPTENVYKAPVTGCQWVRGVTYTFEPTAVTSDADFELPIGGTVQPMAYQIEA